jgi:hypothetical protein
MAQPDPGSDRDVGEVLSRLGALETRLASLETLLGVEPRPGGDAAVRHAPPPGGYVSRPENAAADGLEVRIGESTLPWVGSAVLLLGIMFAMGYVSSLGHPWVGSGLGYVAVVALFLLSRLWKRRLPYLGRVMLTASLLLVYYATMRLHFFSADPLLPPAADLLLLLAVVGLQIYLALRLSAQSLAALALLLGLWTAALANATHVTLPLVALCALIAVLLAAARGWCTMLAGAVVLVYASHVLWLLGNPAVNYAIRGVSEPQFNLVYLLLYGALFVSSVGFRTKPFVGPAPHVAPAVLSGAALFAVGSLVAFAQYRQEYPSVYLAQTLFFLAASMASWRALHAELIPAVYACFGYVALSLVIYGHAGLPDSFQWLALQSLLVVSMALWYRSKILVVLNSLMYVGILGAYLAGSSSSNLANFSFALVAIGTARIMNWQRERLTLRTKLLRNVYLAISLVFLLYALHQAVPRQLVTLSWTLTAVCYFTLSIVLHNVKYRWMAMFTLFFSILHLFLVDLVRLDASFRVAAFLFVGAMAIASSLFYSRIRGLIESGVDPTDSETSEAPAPARSHPADT